MARQETVLSVFVASPSDVQSEREILEEVIQEINGTWSKNLRIRIELIRWETNAFPGIGIDAQDVINHQIEETFDIFIGLMWCRFGTPTLRAGSGTQEEFNRAMLRYRSNPNSVSIMMYFKDEALAPSKINFTQAQLVNDFRESLGEEGALYWMFKDSSEFEKLLRIHLTRKLQEWIPKNLDSAEINTKSNIPILNFETKSAEEDLGLFDTIDIFEKEFEKTIEVSGRIANATQELGKKIEERTAENNLLINKKPSDNGFSALRKFISKAAEDMNFFVKEMEKEIPLFSYHNENGMNAYIKAMEIATEFPLGEDDANTMIEARKAINYLNSVLNGVENQMEEFKASVDSLPKITSELTKAKRNVVLILQKFIEHLQTAQNLAKEAEFSTLKFEMK
ncbi:DUF4062 domain-containing protein [Janthinobacterium lividum]